MSSEHHSELENFCQEVLHPLRRTDQRRWGREYVKGLTNCSGRRTVRRMLGDGAPDRSCQSLQQFVNQSPWDHLPVRQALTGVVASAVQPLAWVVDEVVFAKNGRHSAGVDRQYSWSAGRVRNCQLTLAVSLLAEEGAFPLNWRLMMPPSWDDAVERRRRAHVPDHARHQPGWRHVLEIMDEMADGWPTPAVPLVGVEGRPSEADRLLAALDERSAGYVVEVRGDTQALLALPHADTLAAVPGGPGSLRRPMPLSAVAGLAEARRRQMISWRTAEGHVNRTCFVVTPVRAPVLADGSGDTRPGQQARRLLVAEWPTGRPEPRTYWLTNLLDRPLSDVVSLVKQAHRSRVALAEMETGFGLGDFEGRSYSGWHHHVTLVSVAYAHAALAGLPRRSLAAGAR